MTLTFRHFKCVSPTFFTPKYDKGKWSNYYIVPVIENPSNLKRIRKMVTLTIISEYDYNFSTILVSG